MRIRHLAFTACLATLSLGGCATLAGDRAPASVSYVDAERLYAGRWLEVARRPMIITDNCVAGATDYTRQADGTITQYDTCRVGSASGEVRDITGEGEILDPGVNAELRVQYLPLIARTYRIVALDPDYRWFITVDPSFRDLYIYTREEPSAEDLARLVDRARALGYPVENLEFPDQPPA